MTDRYRVFAAVRSADASRNRDADQHRKFGSERRMLSLSAPITSLPSGGSFALEQQRMEHYPAVVPYEIQTFSGRLDAWTRAGWNAGSAGHSLPRCRPLLSPSHSVGAERSLARSPHARRGVNSAGRRRGCAEPDTPSRISRNDDTSCASRIRQIVLPVITDAPASRGPNP